jgi:hypothetical protein
MVSNVLLLGLKVVGNEKWGGSGGWLLFKDGIGLYRCLFAFSCFRRLFFNVFKFPVCKAQLIGEWDENRCGAPKCSVRLFFKLFYVWSANRWCETCYTQSTTVSVPSHWDPTHPLSCKQVVHPWYQRGGYTHLQVKGLGVPIRMTGEKA